MGKPRTYSAEYRRRMVELARASDRSPEQLAKEFGVHANSIRTWMKQADIDEGIKPGLVAAEREELVRLRREVAHLQEEREILKKAAAWFAQEATRPSKKRTDS